MSKIKQLQNLIKTPFQLGWGSVTQYALYQIGLHSGYFKAHTPEPHLLEMQKQLSKSGRSILPCVPAQDLKEALGDQLNRQIGEADALLDGNVILFDELNEKMDLSPHSPLLHWSDIERGKFHSDRDIKFIWEPARFGWSFTLAKAFHLSGEARYRLSFKSRLDEFNQLNPPYAGANWTSGQEAALRIMALSFAHHIFSQSPTTPPDLLREIRVAVAVNAARIPPTLCYARSQRNNHLISEGVGLYTAGCLLERYPEAMKWKQLGWTIFQQAVLDQIEPDGTYIQHSANYHRLILDEAIWLAVLARQTGDSLSESAMQRLAQSTQFLFNMLDPISGLVPNLGHQDGSNVLPLACAGHLDYRPTLQAAGRIFLHKDLFEAGPWDEKSCWLGLESQEFAPFIPINPLRLGDANDWASLRAVRYHSRPAHADQLHVEIWHNGQNLALDAGTYLYNAEPPWRNGLRTTRVHNTVSIDDQDQMLPSSRFLWLDWADAEILSTNPRAITACHHGYQKLGITHQRTLRKTLPCGWEIVDEIQCQTHNIHPITLHWLLPDLSFTMQNDILYFTSPSFSLHFSNDRDRVSTLQIIRAGAFMAGQSDRDASIYGWFSPTYGLKQPALSVLYTLDINTSVALTTKWEFSENRPGTV